MAQSHVDDMDYFIQLTNWTDRDRVVQFLEMCEWNLEQAVEIFFSGAIDRESMTTSTSIESSTEQRTLHNHNADVGQRSTNLSLPESPSRLYNSLIHSPATSNQSNNDVNASNRASFLVHVDQLVAADTNMDSPIFTVFHQFDEQTSDLLRYIDTNVIGANREITTPWGKRRMIYADYTASGRALWFIENYILNNVLPFYANTHSENNACASQTTKLREGARALIKRCVNATDEDVLIFTGSGSTSAINKLAHVLNLRDETVRSSHVVFVSTFEHHSNILPWKETGVEIERIPNNKEGLLDREVLEQKLAHYTNELKRHVICTFNAASNVTGIRTDVDTISTLVHQYSGKVFWDYAAAAPYLPIDMNASSTAWKDAVFISTHKFVGGPSTPGILIAKKSLFTNPVPCDCGGGTVNYVTRDRVEYLKDIEAREEGGTPSIVESIRAGLVFHLKETVDPRFIETREEQLVEKFFRRFRNHPTLFILGSTTVPRLAIFSFLIYVESVNRYLHHHFVCMLLNDLFGIQVRSGCSCAGPYVLDLLNIDEERATIYADFITEEENDRFDSTQKSAMMKPGFTRFNLSYFASDDEVDYILDALEFIASNGWKFLPLYTYDPNNASWHLRNERREHHGLPLHSLDAVTYHNGTMQETVHGEQNQLFNSISPQPILTSTSNDPLEQAKTMVMNIPKYVYENVDLRTDPPLNIPDEYKKYIWFVTPKEIILKMFVEYEQNQELHRIPVPFRPQSSAPSISDTEPCNGLKNLEK